MNVNMDREDREDRELERGRVLTMSLLRTSFALPHALIT